MVPIRPRPSIPASEFAFAKTVETADGPAILVAGRVMRIVSSNPEADTEALVSALRSRASPGEWYQSADAMQQARYCGSLMGDIASNSAE